MGDDEKTEFLAFISESRVRDALGKDSNAESNNPPEPSACYHYVRVKKIDKPHLGDEFMQALAGLYAENKKGTPPEDAVAFMKDLMQRFPLSTNHPEDAEEARPSKELSKPGKPVERTSKGGDETDEAVSYDVDTAELDGSEAVKQPAEASGQEQPLQNSEAANGQDGEVAEATNVDSSEDVEVATNEGEEGAQAENRGEGGERAGLENGEDGEGAKVEEVEVANEEGGED
eukprot:gene26726-32837_t